MTCPTCQEHFSTLLEDPSAAPAAASQHLESCAECALAFAEYRETVHRLRSLPVVAPPPDLADRISRALDEASPDRGFGTLWQPLAAGASMAACLCLVLWAVVLNPLNTDPAAISSHVTYTRPTVAPPGVPLAPERVARPHPVRPVVAAHPAAMRPARSVPGQRPRPSAQAQPPQFGTWETQIARLPGQVSPHELATGDKPAGTFAAGDPVEPVAPLNRRPGEVQLAFAPPLEKPVGRTVVGELTVTSQAEAMIKVRVEPAPGLSVINASGGLLYEGPMRHGQTLKLPLRLNAWREGTQRLRVRLESDVPGVAGDLEIAIPGFVGEVGKNGGAPVTLRFQEASSFSAIRDIAAAAGARVVIDEEVDTHKVTTDFSAGVPFAAALRILCDECGYRISERNGVYHITR